MNKKVISMAMMIKKLPDISISWSPSFYYFDNK